MTFIRWHPWCPQCGTIYKEGDWQSDDGWCKECYKYALMFEEEFGTDKEEG